MGKRGWERGREVDGRRESEDDIRGRWKGGEVEEREER